MTPHAIPFSTDAPHLPLSVIDRLSGDDKRGSWHEIPRLQGLVLMPYGLVPAGGHFYLARGLAAYQRLDEYQALHLSSQTRVMVSFSAEEPVWVDQSVLSTLMGSTLA